MKAEHRISLHTCEMIRAFEPIEPEDVTQLTDPLSLVRRWALARKAFLESQIAGHEPCHAGLLAGLPNSTTSNTVSRRTFW